MGREDDGRAALARGRRQAELWSLGEAEQEVKRWNLVAGRWNLMASAEVYRQTDRQTDRQTHRHTGRHTDTQTHRRTRDLRVEYSHKI